MRYLIAAILFFAVGCAPKPPAEPIRGVTPVPSPTVPPIAPPASDSDLGAERHAREITLRLRNVDCNGIGIGSAVAIAPRLLATNRHVVEGARSLEVQTWDGRSVHVRAIEVASDQDLGLVRVDTDLPALAPTAPDAAPGDTVSAVGYPEGGQFHRSTGTVVDYVDGSIFGQASRIMRVTIPLKHGNSGGAVLNERGEMVGVVFALELASGYGLAIPASSLLATVANAKFSAAPQGC